jgi:hypothetical protein
MRFLPIGAFVLRHLVAVPLIGVALCFGWIVLYFLLLAIAIVSDSGIGSPLAFPAGLLLIVVSTAFLGWGVFTPACAVGAVVCGVFRLPKLAEIPIVWAAACLLGYALSLICLRVMIPESMPGNAQAMIASVMFLSIPVGIYWWLTEGPFALFDLGKRLWKRFQPMTR